MEDLEVKLTEYQMLEAQKVLKLLLVLVALCHFLFFFLETFVPKIFDCRGHISKYRHYMSFAGINEVAQRIQIEDFY